MQILLQQYELVKEGRETLFQYCESLAPQHLLTNHSNFGERSIAYLLVHISQVYFFWLGQFPKIEPDPIVNADDTKAMGDIKLLYGKVDVLTEKFLSRFTPNTEETISGTIPGRNQLLTVTPLQLFTHVITHEYHHKGQILSMSRQMGYTPIDTDIIRFS